MKLEMDVIKHIAYMTEAILKPILGRRYFPIQIVLHDKAEQDFKRCFGFFRYCFTTENIPVIAELHFMFQVYPLAADNYNYTHCGASRFIGVFVHELAHIITVFKDKNFDKANAHGRTWRKNIRKLGYDVVAAHPRGWSSSVLSITAGNEIISSNFSCDDQDVFTFPHRQDAFIIDNIEQIRKDFYVA